MTKIKIGENQYPAALAGSVKDSRWGGRESVSITLSMSAVQANVIFQTGLIWSLMEETELEDGTTETTEHDMSAYSVAGDITDHRDGSVTVKMGKKTALELSAESNAELDAALEEAYELLYGGDQA